MDLEFMILDTFEQFKFWGIETEDEATDICNKIQDAELNDPTYKFQLSHIDDSRGTSFLDCLIKEDQRVHSEQETKRKEAAKQEADRVK
jgi:hypothetical protein